MNQSEREMCQELRKELMVLEADYKDLQKKLFNWSKRFFEFFKIIDSVNDEREKNEL